MRIRLAFPYLVAIASMLLWGMSFVWTSIVLEYYSPITVIFLRLLFSTGFLFAILLFFNPGVRILKGDYKLFFLSALFNPFLYFLGENYGVKFTTPTISAVIIATIPLMVPIFAYISLRERLNRLNIAGLLISFFGVLIMLFNKNFNLEVSVFGIGALAFAVFSAVGYSIYLKILSRKYPPFFIIAVQNLIGVIYFFPVFIVFDFNQFFAIRPSREAIYSLIALAILCSSIAYVFFTMATRDIGVSRANIFANLIPVFTGIFSYFVIGEKLTGQKIFGIAIVVGGLFLSQVRGRWNRNRSDTFHR